MQRGDYMASAWLQNQSARRAFWAFWRTLMGSLQVLAFLRDVAALEVVVGPTNETSTESILKMSYFQHLLSHRRPRVRKMR